MDGEYLHFEAHLSELLQHPDNPGTVQQIVTLLGDPITRKLVLQRLAETISAPYRTREESPEKFTFSPEIIEENEALPVNAQTGQLHNELKTLGSQACGDRRISVIRHLSGPMNTKEADMLRYIIYPQRLSPLPRGPELAKFSWKNINSTRPENSHREIDDRLRGHGLSTQLLALGESAMARLGKKRVSLSTEIVGTALWAISQEYELADTDVTPAIVRDLLKWKGSYDADEKGSVLSSHILLVKNL